MPSLRISLAKTATTLVLLGLVLLTSLFVVQQPDPAGDSLFPLPARVSPESRQVAAYFNSLKDDPQALRQFLYAFPKGAELHTHLSGAVYAESYIRWAEAEDLCVYVESYLLSSCETPMESGLGGATRMKLSEALAEVPDYRYRLIDAFSVRNYAQGYGSASSADQFFASFDKFDAASRQRSADMFAEVLTRAGSQNVAYMEIMTFPDSLPFLVLGGEQEWPELSAPMQAGLENPGSKVLDPVVEQAWQEYFRNREAALYAAGLEEKIQGTSQTLAASLAEARELMHCNSATASAGCGVRVGLLAQALRDIDSPGSVFALLAACFRLAEINPAVTGVNFVMREDGKYALRDYTLHMNMLRYFMQQHPQIKLSLHAGELTMGLVPPEQLRDHISQALNAGASRIGHGVDIVYENDSRTLLASMQDKVLVEINLTSNEKILGVSGRDHPFMTYVRAGVPVALSTDDEGVLRIDLTHEYVRATLEYQLSYFDLKHLARNGLRYSFLPEAEKQQLLQNLDNAFAGFENSILAASGSQSRWQVFSASLQRIAGLN